MSGDQSQTIERNFKLLEIEIKALSVHQKVLFHIKFESEMSIVFDMMLEVHYSRDVKKI